MPSSPIWSYISRFSSVDSTSYALEMPLNCKIPGRVGTGRSLVGYAGWGVGCVCVRVHVRVHVRVRVRVRMRVLRVVAGQAEMAAFVPGYGVGAAEGVQSGRRGAGAAWGSSATGVGRE